MLINKFEFENRSKWRKLKFTMNDGLDSKKVLSIKVFAITFSIAIALSLIVVIFNYMNKVKIDSISVTPNKFFCPLGKEIDIPVVIKLESLNEVFHQDYGVGDMMVSAFISAKPTLDLANTMYGILQNSERKNEVKKIKQIEIPQNACHIGSMDTTPTSIDKSFASGLEFDLLHSDIQLYAWNTVYKLNSGKEGADIHLIMILDEKIIYGKIQQLGNTKMRMDIFYGCRN